ncbi:NAD-dependent deacylase [Paenibacillus yanchengensis]|uniref:protein acetyllysine N-acetyltransferase n=1 Tax=Paenibacillus yanchengensis TaxID=2035833 RepID=A0ABW4YL99_9BACL
MSNEWQAVHDVIRSGQRIVFFGGAGTSTESGIPDFRSANGIFAWKDMEFTPEQMLSRSFFDRYPALFYQFYVTKMLYPNAEPNLAHVALAKLEERGQLLAVITQNIDGLHQRAGSKRVLELHGSVQRNYCMNCNQFYTLEELLALSHVSSLDNTQEKLRTESAADGQGEIPYCRQCNGVIKPDVVLYEESLNMDTLEQAVRAIEQADVLIVGGTSLTVQPAASLVQYYKGDRLIVINKSTTSLDRSAAYTVNDSIAAVLGQLVTV